MSFQKPSFWSRSSTPESRRAVRMKTTRFKRNRTRYRNEKARTDIACSRRLWNLFEISLTLVFLKFRVSDCTGQVTFTRTLLDFRLYQHHRSVNSATSLPRRDSNVIERIIRSSSYPISTEIFRCSDRNLTSNYSTNASDEIYGWYPTDRWMIPRTNARGSLWTRCRSLADEMILLGHSCLHAFNGYEMCENDIALRLKEIVESEMRWNIFRLFFAGAKRDSRIKFNYVR